jgi:hypothetical protein
LHVTNSGVGGVRFRLFGALGRHGESKRAGLRENDWRSEPIVGRMCSARRGSKNTLELSTKLSGFNEPRRLPRSRTRRIVRR